jgi:hypothetical protein
MPRSRRWYRIEAARLLEGLERLKGLPKAVAEGKVLPEVIRLNAEGESVRKG